MCYLINLYLFFNFQDKNAFILISGSYLLNIYSIDSDVDIIVILAFNYKCNTLLVTKEMLDKHFMGGESLCNFESRMNCSEQLSLYCILCKVDFVKFLLNNFYEIMWVGDFTA